MKWNDKVLCLPKVAFYVFFVVLLIVLGTVDKGGANADKHVELPLVSFQSDKELLLADSSTKVEWSTALGNNVFVEGVFVLAGKDYYDRLILDNTSIYLQFDGPTKLPEEGTLVSVNGKWVSFSFGSDDRTVQGNTPSRAYGIKVTRYNSIKKVRSFVVQQSKPR